MQWWPAFVAWLRAADSQLNSPEAWEPRSASDPATGASRGIGLFATRDLDADELLFEIPPGLMLVAPDRFDLAEVLLRERLLALDPDSDQVQEEGISDGDGDDDDVDVDNGACAAGEACVDDDSDQDAYDEDQDSFWLAYVQSLPSWDEPQRLPQGNLFMDVAMREDEDHLASALDPLVAQALDFAPAWVTELGFQREWLISLALVTSRMHVVWQVDPFGDWVARSALVPLADLLNGASGAAVNARCETRQSDGAFVCRTISSVPAQTELLVGYGSPDASEEDLRDTYGFVP